MEVLKKDGSVVNLATEEYVESKHQVYAKGNVNYVNLQDVCVYLGVYGGLFLVVARNTANYISVVMAYWDRGYNNKYVPDIIFIKNIGFSYSANNNTGTIAFDASASVITVVPLT